MIRALFIVMLTASTLSAQQKVTEHTVKRMEGAAAAGTLADMSWIAGRWTGEGLGGRVEEIWSPADGNAMIGCFRLIKDGKPVFYEFMSLLETEKGLAMRLKHFHPDVRGWEEKDKFVEFVYAGTIDGVNHFDGLAFHRDGENAVTIYLALRGKDGQVREEKFRMTREK